jgi:hypothetical protein
VAIILIPQDPDPYVKASKFFGKHGLNSIYITITRDSIALQMALAQHSKTVQKAENNHPASCQASSEKKSDTLESHTMQTELKKEY